MTKVAIKAQNKAKKVVLEARSKAQKKSKKIELKAPVATKFPVSVTKPSRGPYHATCHLLPALVGNGIKLFGGW